MYRSAVERIERRRRRSPSTPRTNEAAHWTRPTVVVEIKFNEWTSDGRLRQPVFVGVRTTRPARRPSRAGIDGEGAMTTTTERRRVAKRPPDAAHASTDAIVRSAASDRRRRRHRYARPADGGSLDVTNLDKVFFPATKHTKGDVMRFYARDRAGVLLPAIADRPARHEAVSRTACAAKRSINRRRRHIRPGLRARRAASTGQGPHTGRTHRSAEISPRCSIWCSLARSRSTHGSRAVPTCNSPTMRSSISTRDHVRRSRASSKSRTR